MGEKSSKMAAVAPVIVEATAKHTATVSIIFFLSTLGEVCHKIFSYFDLVALSQHNGTPQTAWFHRVVMHEGFRRALN